jgi:hypothetical protein
LNELISIETESTSYKRQRDEVKKANPFERFFKEEDIKIQLAKKGSQLTDLDGHCKFEHRSIQHYFVAKALYEELIQF